MKLHRLVNRKHKGVTYYRFLIMVPPEHVVALKWKEGQELEMDVRGGVLHVRTARSNMT
jgi:hypothetical protein